MSRAMPWRSRITSLGIPWTLYFSSKPEAPAKESSSLTQQFLHQFFDVLIGESPLEHLLQLARSIVNKDRGGTVKTQLLLPELGLLIQHQVRERSVLRFQEALDLVEGFLFVGIV